MSSSVVSEVVDDHRVQPVHGLLTRKNIVVKQLFSWWGSQTRSSPPGASEK